MEVVVVASGRRQMAGGLKPLELRENTDNCGGFVAAMRGKDGLMARPGSRNYWKESERELEPTEAQDKRGTEETEVMGIL